MRINQQQFIQKSFTNFFSLSNSRILFEINQLVELLKLQKDAESILRKYWNCLNNKNVINVFKFLILINKLIMEFAIEPVSMISQLLTIIQPVIQLNIKSQQNQSFIYQKHLINLKHSKQSQNITLSNNTTINDNLAFNIMLNKKLLQPYKLYLMKRCQYLPKKSQSIDRMFQLMNLIHSATCFCDIIYTLGRYYVKMYPFVVDFNVVIGKILLDNGYCIVFWYINIRMKIIQLYFYLFYQSNDLNTVYNQMVKYTPKPPSVQILLEYQKLHQKMYIVYYNCYFYQYLKTFIPRWVVTDIIEEQNNCSNNRSNINKMNLKNNIKNNKINNDSPLKNPQEQSYIKITNMMTNSMISTKSSMKNQNKYKFNTTKNSSKYINNTKNSNHIHNTLTSNKNGYKYSTQSIQTNKTEDLAQSYLFEQDINQFNLDSQYQQDYQKNEKINLINKDKLEQSLLLLKSMERVFLSIDQDI